MNEGFLWMKGLEKLLVTTKTFRQSGYSTYLNEFQTSEIAFS